MRFLRGLATIEFREGCDKIVGKAGEGLSRSKSRQSIATPVRAWKSQTNDRRPEGPALAGCRLFKA
jgi:hypothetical protein